MKILRHDQPDFAEQLAKALATSSLFMTRQIADLANIALRVSAYICRRPLADEHPRPDGS